MTGRVRCFRGYRKTCIGIFAAVLGFLVAHASAGNHGGVTDMTDRSYVGLWATADGHVRHELLPNGRYDEARGTRESAYQGRYEITGDHIEYWDDTGFTADGDFIDGVLHHGGMVLYRQEAPPGAR
tara:strand:- start:17 stop:394 length:378 start_codon:yes stop_codon:yes gene_type:complete